MELNAAGTDSERTADTILADTQADFLDDNPANNDTKNDLHNVEVQEVALLPKPMPEILNVDKDLDANQMTNLGDLTPQPTL